MFDNLSELDKSVAPNSLWFLSLPNIKEYLNGSMGPKRSA